MKKHYQYDVLVIGSGAAGLTLALSLAQQARVAVLSKNEINQGSTWFAQGGIAAVLDDQDSIDAHVADTLIAGAGLCHEDAVRFTVERSKDAIQWLIAQGVNFTKENSNGDYHLTKEGGHSHRRIIHSADATGQAVHSTLIEQVQQQGNIDIFEHHVAVNLISQADADSRKLRCTGAYVLDSKHDAVHVFQAKVVVLATGGASKVYLVIPTVPAATVSPWHGAPVVA
jgi:L-aspartate oxidase